MANTLALTPNSNAPRFEFPAAAGSALAFGMIAELVNGEYQEQSTAAVKASAVFVDQKITTASGIDSTYTPSEDVFTRAFPSGELVRALCADAQVLTVGTPLTTAGDGTLTAAGATAANTVAFSRSQLTTSGQELITVQIA